ncbi:NapC/NirT family cytochrome c [Motiliproteus sp. MSK22-1]|uniref:NapC/NirT family cytochrome c n=1 Tax=Motiliproteus sp. MSK22-1 TaxID=1897630 RepID=UPI000977ABA4|nr:NapC/NirT family cytochrome c [Motiliproteus sp. MSK22-1]OMH36244.1 cytochrome C552 [Motiliproteus sp. MSK22-1]
MAIPQALKTLMSRKLILGTSVGVALIFMLAGVIFWGGFNTAMEVTNTMEFCISCHEMEENVYQEYKKSIHYNNRAGVQATCSDCHVPRPWGHKVVRKIQASNEVLHKVLGSIDTPEKFDNKRLELANNVWKAMKSTDSRECRNCHDFKTMQPENQKPRARKQHMNAMTAGNTCIDCHKGIAHKPVHDQLSDEEIESLTKPDPSIAINLPPQWEEFIAKEEEEKRLKKEQAEAAAEAARLAREKAKAEAAELAKQQAEAGAVATASTQAPSAASAGNGVDWSLVPSREVTIFYPGQTSMEWVLRGKDHGGARPVKAGDRCVDCHDAETADMGQKIVTGEKKKVEPTLIPGKRGSIPVQVQASYDATNLYLRFQWADAEHTPVPFVEGGKMDPENQMKLAFMLATDDIKYAGQAGCWGTCHADLDSMPFAPEGQQVTKYLTESRTKIELKGRRGKALGGWDKLKSEDEIASEFKAGHYMDIIRYKSGSKLVEDGHILASREMTEANPTEFVANKEGDQWVVEVVRKLNTGKEGDVPLATDQVYNFGFAIHDDYTQARYHHVSLGYKLGFDNVDAEINAIAR